MNISPIKTDKQSGFLLINKPSGPTSHDIINKLRRITGIKKIGHAGTLDPFASGLLIVAVGREATREIGRFVKLDKEYVATLYLGAVSNTYDRTGQISNFQFPISKQFPNFKFQISKEGISNVLNEFLGKQLQTPPMFSAKKVKGRKLYELARRGIEIEREPVEIEIFSIKLLEYIWPFLKIKVRVSSGTYIRTLASEIGEKLDCGAYLEELVRTSIGSFKLSAAAHPEGMTADNWQLSLLAEL